MNGPDVINGLFEGIGGLMLWRNVAILYQDKRVAGVSVLSTAFFTSWGYWNLYYYPALGQWASFVGGLLIVAANTVWVTLALRYRNNR